MDGREHEQPAKRFERDHGVSGIAGNYRFASDPAWTRDAIQDRLRPFTAWGDMQEATARRVRDFGAAIDQPAIDASTIRTNGSLHAAFEKFVHQQEAGEMSAILTAVEALNAEEVAKIRFNRTDSHQVLDVVHGIVSGFNAEDINHYLATASAGASRQAWERSAQEVARRSLEKQVLQHFGDVSLGWVASMPTLEKVWRQIKDRPLQAIVAGVEQAHR